MGRWGVKTTPAPHHLTTPPKTINRVVRCPGQGMTNAPHRPTTPPSHLKQNGMTAQFARAAHVSGRTGGPVHNAPHAALLIDFDNVTMGIRSDLTKELKNLLNSDIIKGKVAVQRAYADWRRYPQYIVPLAENSVDLIFAPAYGTSKKNATDIRLSIDALELVFTRPEIGTFILLSGDSDFSSLVLKLKEYGKYVIGVGIRESASDLLVQNCDEYYSYSALTGLTRAGDEDVTPLDPWECAEIAVQRMAENNDVMRSDRLKQVMLELDPNFDEKALGFTKFNRFLHEAQTRGLISLKKLENGQYEVAPFSGERADAEAEAAPAAEQQAREVRRSRRGRGRERSAAAATGSELEAPTTEMPAPELVETIAEPEPEPVAAVSVGQPARPEKLRAATPAAVEPGIPAHTENGLKGAYDLLRRATRDVTQGKNAARDSDVKRRILEIDPKWSESSVGFTKFSRFLRQAHDAEVINLRKLENGNYELTLPGSEAAAAAAAAPQNGDDARGSRRSRGGRGGGRDRDRDRKGGRAKHEEQLSIDAAPASRERAAAAPPAEPAATKPAARPEPAPPAPATTETAPAAASTRSALYRRVSRRGAGATPSGPPPLLEGQAIGAARASQPAPVIDQDDTVKRLTALKGVGQKTAEAAVAAFGPGVLDVVRNDPKRVLDELGTRRAQPLIDALAAEKPRASGARKAGRKSTAKSARPRKSAAKK